MKKRKIFLMVASFIIFIFYACQCESESGMYLQKRIKMVKTQIENRGISDSAVLEAMRTVERHLFVPDSLQSYAYIDDPLPIGFNQTISQPYIVALMTASLELNKSDRVLEIGTGSGYQAAILGEIVDSVFTIEIVKGLADRSSALLKQLGYQNITVKHGDGYIGWEEIAPFDAIIVTAAPDEIPQPLIDQLSNNGRMIIPVGEGHQQLILLKKVDNKIIKSNIAAVRFVPMTGEAEKQDSSK